MNVFRTVLNLGGILRPLDGSKTTIGLVLIQLGEALQSGGSGKLQMIGIILANAGYLLTGAGALDKAVKVAIKKK